MKLSSADMEDLIALAVTAAERASAHISAEAGKPREVMSKEGGATMASQIVTEVDFESQRLILETLEESMTRYELGLLTEESVDDSSRLTSDYFWCIDPIDGTLPFTENVAGYSVSIALVDRQGVSQIGVIKDPVTGMLMHAVRGGGAFRSGEPLRLPEGRRLTHVMDRSFADQENYEQIMEGLREISNDQGLETLVQIKQGGAAMNACWALDEAPAVYFKFPKPKRGGGSFWDYAASACIYGEVEGAVVSDIRGRPLHLNREGETFMHEYGVVFATSQVLAEAIYRLYREVGE